MACRWRKARSAPSTCRTRRDARRALALPLARFHLIAAFELFLARFLCFEAAGLDVARRFIGRYDDSGTRHKMVGELQCAAFFGPVEDALAVAQDNGERHEHQPVDQSGTEQRRIERAAALDEQV